MAAPLDNGGIDPSLYKAMSHPIRLEILAALGEPGAVLSPSELARRVGMPVQKLGYHFRVLAKFGLIEIVGEEPAQGSLKHLYRANRRAVAKISPASAALAGSPAKTAVAAGSLSAYLEAAARAIDAGAFERRDDARFSWDTIELDAEGMAEMSKLVADFHGRLLELEEECAPRIEKGNPPVNAIYAIGGFELPPSGA